MRIKELTLSLLPLAASSLLPSFPRIIFSNPLPSANEEVNKIPSPYESAVMARRILHLTPRGTLSTVFPSSKTLENRPSGVDGLPIGLMDYIADCESSGNPTILAINIATSFKNAAAGSNVSLSLQWTPPFPPKSRISSSNPTTSYSAANLPRFSILGYVEKISEEEVESSNIETCFTATHPDAKYWLPGNSIHESEWVRLVVQEVYWVGGFGDRAYIGWLPIEEWHNITKREWEGIQLPGEKKGWKEWAVETVFKNWEL